MGSDGHFEGMREDGKAALRMDRRRRLFERQPFLDWLGDPQAEDMSVGAGDFGTRNDVKRVQVLMLVRPQTRAYAVMVGNGDHVERAQTSNTIQHLLNRTFPVADVGVHVHISTTVQFHRGSPIMDNTLRVQANQQVDDDSLLTDSKIVTTGA